jgi:predicted RND superfamily exporter protein
MTLLVPVILIAVANNYGIYLVARYQEITLQNPGLSNAQVLTRILQSLNMPVIFSGLTTIAGILGLLTHSITAARQVGILAASGVAIALIMSLMFIPAMIYGRKQLPQLSFAGKSGHVFFDRFLKTLSAWIIRNPGRILIVSGVFILILSSGIFLLKIDTNEEDLFPKDHPVRQAAEVINSKFGGSQTVSAMVSCDIKDPSVLKGIDSITMMMEKQKGVGNVFSISQAERHRTVWQ